MKKDDFERLKAVCEKEGFELEISPIWDQTYKISKKDIWDGVEFVRYVCSDTGTHIKKITGQNDDQIIFDGGWIYKFAAEPSTEEAYVEQLKKEALERFGEIKEGDRFDITPIDPNASNNWATYPDKPDFLYRKDIDRLLAKGITIYRQGKWAERVKERVKVTYSGASCKPHPIRNDMDLHEVRFYVNRTNGLPTSNAFDFLASQLEKYLNGEIE